MNFASPPGIQEFLGKADNTVRETKNGCTMKMMCSLLQKMKVSLGGFFFPRVGHSHGSLGILAAACSHHEPALGTSRFLSQFLTVSVARPFALGMVLTPLFY